MGLDTAKKKKKIEDRVIEIIQTGRLKKTGHKCISVWII